MFNERSISAKTGRKILSVFLRRVTQKNLAPTGPMVGEKTEGSKKSIYKTATQKPISYFAHFFEACFGRIPWKFTKENHIRLKFISRATLLRLLNEFWECFVLETQFSVESA